MEQVLDVYKRPYDIANPVVCMDESPKQLIEETRVPIKMKPGHLAKYDYEYRRHGVANIFIASEPLISKRIVKITKTKKKADWAQFMKEISDQYPQAKRITIVMDNYGTHKIGSFYEVFTPEIAKMLIDRFEFVYTPKHGSWLNMAEIELNIIQGQCFNRRIKDISMMRREAKAWMKHRNSKKCKINWQFTAEDARIKLRRLYPSIEA